MQHLFRTCNSLPCKLNRFWKKERNDESARFIGSSISDHSNFGELVCGKSTSRFQSVDNQELTINTNYGNQTGSLYDSSKVNLVSGGWVNVLALYDTSTTNISGGFVTGIWSYDHGVVNSSGGESQHFVVCNFSTANFYDGKAGSLGARQSGVVNVFGGEISEILSTSESGIINFYDGTVSRELLASDSSIVNLYDGVVAGDLDAFDTSIVNITGGYISGYIRAANSSTMNIYGGSLGSYLSVYDSGTVNIYGQNIQLGGGLSLDGNRVLGTGYLSGAWMDGTPWNTNVTYNTATIYIIPEPCTLLLLGLGAAVLRKKARN